MKSNIIKFTRVSDEIPPKGIELIAKSPDGTLHLTNWREGYNIFTCQCKRESSADWFWASFREEY